jgi:hypothetical protein
MGTQVNRDLGIGPGATVTSKQRYQQTVEMLSPNLKVIFSTLLFTLAVTMKLLYRRRPYTFTELLVFTLYLYGVSYLFSCLLSLMMVVHLPGPGHKVLNYTLYLLSLVYTTWAICQFYRDRGVRGWLKAGAAYVISALFLMVFAMVTMIVVAIGGKLLEKL